VKDCQTYPLSSFLRTPDKPAETKTIVGRTKCWRDIDGFKTCRFWLLLAWTASTRRFWQGDVFCLRKWECCLFIDPPCHIIWKIQMEMVWILLRCHHDNAKRSAGEFLKSTVKNAPAFQDPKICHWFFWLTIIAGELTVLFWSCRKFLCAGYFISFCSAKDGSCRHDVLGCLRSYSRYTWECIIPVM